MSELSTDPEEQRKAILAIALEGERLVVLDNASGSVGSPTFDAALTATSVRGRILGKTERSPDVPLFITWIVTGNNLTLKGDLHRRVLMCRLLPQQERPEERSGFEIADLLAYAEEHRAELIIDCLTILRGFILAGRPQAEIPHFGSFENWGGLVRQAIYWASTFDPCASRSAIIPESRGEGVILAALFAAWAELPGGTTDGISAKRALELVKADLDLVKETKAAPQYPQLQDALSELARDGRELPDAHRLGYTLRKSKDRIIGSWQLRVAKEDRTGVTRWMVCRIPGGPFAGR